MNTFKSFLLALGFLWLLRTVLSTLADAKKAEYHIPSYTLPPHLKRQIDDWVQQWAAANRLLEK